jgi:putative transposase
MVSARVRREQVAYVQTRGLSRRRACALLSVARSTIGYVSRLAVKDAPVVTAMRTLAGQYPRFGYRMVMPFLARQQHVMSGDRAYRLWRQAGLQVPNGDRAAASRPVGRGRCPRLIAITSGRTISFSIAVPMGSS